MGVVAGAEEIANDQIGAKGIGRAVGIGQAERLFRREEEGACRGVELHVTAGSLIREPFADAARWFRFSPLSRPVRGPAASAL